ncbi:hypothetical protein TRFO_21344 [Tritrichomonas foetus]|uniref:Mannosyltransferase n=1 Tax=Tritrichomonas foetus TaxID=1144522 RepID=A0A1J4KFB1_9EUKA|nr:hypothetical protein TRFO_21344 [Tritrichomonas foetus]|eukprot:OHT09714.1 hypothetical protein TRFO_21344 [Tritrichomonas foetus]
MELLGFLLIFTTILFGFFLSLQIRNLSCQVCIQFSISWLLGSMMSALILWISTFFLPFSRDCLFILISFQAFFSIFSYFTIRKKKHLLRPIFETSPLLYLQLVFILLFSLYYLNRIYEDFPNSFPKSASEVFNFEMSFISSFRFGPNSLRKNFLYYSDPMHNSHYFTLPSLPLIYLASLMELGLTYSESSIIVCFLNIISTVMALSYFSVTFLKTVDLTSLCFLFNSGWALFRYLSDSPNSSLNNSKYDYIHSFWRNAPWYNPIITFLSTSKHSSFSIPLALFTLTLSHISASYRTYILSGILLALNPSLSVSIGQAISVFCYSNSALFSFIFSIFPILKIYFNIFVFNEKTFSILYKPLWREYQMQGIFYSQVLIWFDSFGPLFFVFILSPILLLIIKDSIFTQKFLASFSAFLVLCFVRIGNDYFENSLGICSIFFPFLVILFLKSLNIVSTRIQGQVKGILTAVKVIVILCYITGSIISLFASLENVKNGWSKNDLGVAEFVKENLERNDVVFCQPISLNPIPALSGRTIFSSKFPELWKRGANVTQEMQVMNKIKETNDVVSVMKKLNYRYVLEIIRLPLVLQNSTYTDFFDVLYENDEYKLLFIKNNN